MNRFELKPAMNDRAMGGAVPYLEIFIDGVSLRELIAGDGRPLPEQISPLGWHVPGCEDFTFRQFQRFLLLEPSDLEDGRNTVLVCALDADPGCGAFSVRMVCKGGCVEWRDFGFENNYDPESRETARYSHLGPFLFEWVEYEAELVRHRGAEQRVASEPARPGSSGGR